MDPITFDLVDANGVPHRYTVVLHPADAGAGVSMALLGLGLEPLARAAGALFDEGGLAIAVNALRDEGDKTRATELLGKLDLPGVAAALGPALGRPSTLALLRSVLAYTHRDGAKLDGIAFSTAYQGNYAEMYRAVWEVAARNRFLPLPDISKLAQLAAK
jgi:hypothetical protein